MPQEPIVVLDAVSRRFGDTDAVRGVSLTIDEGQLIGFVGPSGCGKTTTIRMMCGILAPSSGLVRVFGHDPLLFTSQEQARIGYLPQHFLLYPSLSVESNASFMAGLYGLGLRNRRQRVHEALEMVEMWDVRKKQAANLSGGMQRRLALAATLLHKPQLLFLDEPTTGQDPILRRKIWGWLRSFQNQGRTIVVTTHYAGDAEQCGHVVLMDAGRVIAFDTPAALRRRAYNGDLLELITHRDIYAYLRALEKMRSVRAVEVRGKERLFAIVDDAGASLSEIVAELRAQDLVPDSLREFQPPFDDVFERLIRQQERREQAP